MSWLGAWGHGSLGAWGMGMLNYTLWLGTAICCDLFCGVIFGVLTWLISIGLDVVKA